MDTDLYLAIRNFGMKTRRVGARYTKLIFAAGEVGITAKCNLACDPGVMEAISLPAIASRCGARPFHP